MDGLPVDNIPAITHPGARVPEQDFTIEGNELVDVKYSVDNNPTVSAPTFATYLSTSASTMSTFPVKAPPLIPSMPALVQSTSLSASVPDFMPSLSASIPVFTQSWPTSSSLSSSVAEFTPSILASVPAFIPSLSASIPAFTQSWPTSSSLSSSVPAFTPSTLASVPAFIPSLSASIPSLRQLGSAEEPDDITPQLTDCSREETPSSPKESASQQADPVSSPSRGFAFQDLDCLESLPDVVENLSQAQKQQAAEIERQHQIVQEEKKRLRKEQDKLTDIQGEVSRCKRCICLAEEESTTVSQHCKQLQTDVDKTSLEGLQNTKCFQDSKQKLKEDTRLFAEYLAKMTNHKQLVLDLESSLPVHMELAKQKEKIKALQTEKKAMESELLDLSDGGSTAPQLQLEQEMKSLKEKKHKLVASITSIKTAITTEDTKHACIKQDTDVLRKRNHAQLTRLKKQLKEAQLRNKQWHDDACQLEAQIERLRKFTEE